MTASRWSAIAIVFAFAFASCTNQSPDAGTSPSPSPNVTGPIPSAANFVVLAGHARSVLTSGKLTGLSSMRIEGRFLLAGRVSSPTGEHHMIIDGGPVTISNEAGTLGALGHSIAITAGGAVVTGGAIPPATQRRSAGRANVFPRLLVGVAATVNGAHVTVDGSAAHGNYPITFGSATGSFALYGSAAITGLPATLHVAEDDTTGSVRASFATPTWMSWNGTGSTQIAGRTLNGAETTIIASKLNARLKRSKSGVTIRGNGTATQVAINGTAQLRTTLHTTITAPARQLYPGISENVTWENDDVGPWEAVIRHVRVVDAAAGWLYLHVDPPPLLGGRPGRTPADDPLGCARGASVFAQYSLCTILGPNKGDQETIVFHVPAFQRVGVYTAVFEITGNFPTVRARVVFDVKPR